MTSGMKCPSCGIIQMARATCVGCGSSLSGPAERRNVLRVAVGAFVLVALGGYALDWWGKSSGRTMPQAPASFAEPLEKFVGRWTRDHGDKTHVQEGYTFWIEGRRLDGTFQYQDIRNDVSISQRLYRLRMKGDTIQFVVPPKDDRVPGMNSRYTLTFKSGPTGPMLSGTVQNFDSGEERPIFLTKRPARRRRRAQKG